MIHGGIYYQPGSLKARLCVEGARLMYEYCEQHRIPHERCGKLIVAVSADELPRLDDLKARGIANAVPGLRRVGPDEITDIEPNAVGLQALHAPNTGIVDYTAVARALVGELTAAGADIRFGTEVTGIDGARTPSSAPAKPAAGAHRDRLCGTVGRPAGAPSGRPRDPQIVPFRGAYLGLTPTRQPRLNGMIYPVPDPELPFLGVHITKHITGAVTLGPTAMIVAARDAYLLRRWNWRDSWETATWPGSWRVARRYWRVGLDEIRMAASRKAFVAAAARYLPGCPSTISTAARTPGSARRRSVGMDRWSTTS